MLRTPDSHREQPGTVRVGDGGFLASAPETSRNRSENLFPLETRGPIPATRQVSKQEERG